MAKRKLPSGLRKRGESYYADFMCGGQRIRKRLSTDLEVSKRMLNKLRMRHEAGEVDNDFSVVELIERYFEDSSHGLADGTVKRYRLALETFVDAVQPKYVSDLGYEDVVRFRRDRLADGVSGDYIQYDIDRMRQVIRWGCRKRIIHSNPLEYVEKIKTENKAPVLPLFSRAGRGVGRAREPSLAADTVLRVWIRL